ILPFTDSPPGSTTTSSLSLWILFTAAHGMETTPRNSLLMVSLAPSFLTMLPVTISPLVSTTWSAATAGSPANRRKHKDLLMDWDTDTSLASAALIRSEMAFFVLLPAAAPARLVSARYGFGEHDGGQSALPGIFTALGIVHGIEIGRAHV